MSKPVTIVGGGLAGLGLGIRLRQLDIPVTVIEAGHYPRHRVCGEFISGNGPIVLDRFHLRQAVEAAGAFPAKTVQFIAGANRSPVREMPAAALCLSRHDMDALLAKGFQRLGGELRAGTRWQEKNPCEGVVRANGRRVQPTEDGWRWFGLKAHARGVALGADLEMHVSGRGYVGVNRINGGEVNVCGLFRARPGDAPVQRDWLLGDAGSPLRERLASAQFDENSFCSVAGLSLKPQRAMAKEEICIGDALTMIPPVTGNGMSMAFESAEIAAEPLARYSRGKISWADARQIIANECDAKFARRLAWAALLERMMFSPLLRTSIGGALLRSDWLWNWMFARTR